MSDAPLSTSSFRFRPDQIAIAFVVLLSVGLIYYLAGQRQLGLRNSPSGFEGLKVWLASKDHPVQSFTGGWSLDRTDLGLLIQPIYDTRLNSDRKRPSTQEEILFQADEFDQTAGVIVQKAHTVKSLVILPKWRRGLRLTKFGHPVLLSPQEDVQATLHRLFGRKVGKLHIARQPFAEFAYSGIDGRLNARIYAAQTFDGRGCSPVIGTEGKMLLGLCPMPGNGEAKDVYVLSDPDLLNNHGLRLGDNARIAEQLLPDLAEGSQIVIDYSTRNWLTDPEKIQTRERNWSDLARLFAYPFSLLWAGAGIALILAIWRGGIRKGPVQAEDTVGFADKRTANLARARLMRLTGQDGALLAEYVDTRLQALSAAVFGPGQSPRGGSEAAYLRFVSRKSPDLADQLQQVVTRIRSLPAHAGPNDAIAHLDRFEMILEQIANDT